jgi:hypothetical protein
MSAFHPTAAEERTSQIVGLVPTTEVNRFVDHPCFDWPRQPDVPIQSTMAFPISSGESS